MKKLLAIFTLAASLSIASCDDGGSDSRYGLDAGDDQCDQELIDNITTVSILCNNWSALGYAGYSDCRVNENDRMLTLFLLCEVKEDDSGKEE